MCSYADKVAAVIELWATTRFDTHNIAWVLDMHEAEVERIIHRDREMRYAARAGAAA